MHVRITHVEQYAGSNKEIAGLDKKRKIKITTDKLQDVTFSMCKQASSTVQLNAEVTPQRVH